MYLFFKVLYKTNCFLMLATSISHQLSTSKPKNQNIKDKCHQNQLGKFVLK